MRYFIHVDIYILLFYLLRDQGSSHLVHNILYSSFPFFLIEAIVPMSGAKQVVVVMVTSAPLHSSTTPCPQRLLVIRGLNSA